jgi:hypothetical protein
MSKLFFEWDFVIMKKGTLKFQVKLLRDLSKWEKSQKELKDSSNYSEIKTYRHLIELGHALLRQQRMR